MSIFFHRTLSRSALLQPLMEETSHNLSYAHVFHLLIGHKKHSIVKLGQQVHSQMVVRGIEPNAFVATKMVAMYASLSDLDSAVLAFDHVTQKSNLLYNAMIRAYASYGCFEKTVETYFQMQWSGIAADNFTYPFVLKACAGVGAGLLGVGLGRFIHGKVLRGGLMFDMYVGTSLIDMYVKCGESRDAHRLFDAMPARDVSSWNALIAGYMKDGMVGVAEDLFWRIPRTNIVSYTGMISGYTQNGLGDRALSLFNEMLRDDAEVKPNWVTIMSVLPACARSSDLEKGRKIHNFASDIGLDSNPSIQTALAAMYARCGSLSDARLCFGRISPKAKGLVACNTMISAYASNGYGHESVSTFEDMVRAGVQPDAITFTGLLSGCSHSGLVDTGLKYFNSMREVFKVEPRHEHYACIVDLLSRAGRLSEAENLIYQMPMQAGASIWGALLGGCSKHRNLQLAETAARRLFVLEPENSGNYVLLSNMYAEAGMWEEVDNLRSQFKCQGGKKNPGSSWT